MYEPDSNRAAITAPPPLSFIETVSSSPASPLTPVSEPPPTPFSLSSDKDGNLTDVSGATEIGDDDAVPLPALTKDNDKDKDTKTKPTPLKLGTLTTTTKYASATDADEKPERLHPAELSHIATQFAAKIPPGQFSPAELQGFLLKRKKTPRRALEEVEGWVAGMLVLKASRTRVLAVQ
jgi:chaperone BCS1